MAGRAENTKETLCRNMTIYGHCRYEDKGDRLHLLGKAVADWLEGCSFSHDIGKVAPSSTSAEKYVYNEDQRIEERLNIRG